MQNRVHCCLSATSYASPSRRDTALLNKADLHRSALASYTKLHLEIGGGAGERLHIYAPILGIHLQQYSER